MLTDISLTVAGLDRDRVRPTVRPTLAVSPYVLGISQIDEMTPRSV